MKLTYILLCFQVIVFSSTQAWAQASESEVRNNDIQSVSFAYSKSWGSDSLTDRLPYLQEGSNYLYAIIPENPVPTPNNVDPVKNFKFIRLDNVQGKKIYISPTWPDKTAGAIPQSATGDGCAHTHLSFGVWYRVPNISSKWYYYGGGAMSGVRQSDTGRCIFLVDNPLKSIDARYGWGKEVVEANFTNVPQRIDLAVGGYANTHGWGNCVTAGFKACNERLYMLTYSF